MCPSNAQDGGQGSAGSAGREDDLFGCAVAVAVANLEAKPLMPSRLERRGESALECAGLRDSGGSIGIQLGGIGAMAESRRADLARLGVLALAGGFLATLINSAVAGMLM